MCTGNRAQWMGEGETYTALAGRVECCTPSFHHKWVIDRDDEDLAGRLESWAIEITRDMGCAARWACKLVSGRSPSNVSV